MKRSNRMVHRQNVLVSSRKLQQRRHNKLRTSFQLIIEERWLLQTYSHLIKQLFLPQPLSEREREKGEYRYIRRWFQVTNLFWSTSYGLDKSASYIHETYVTSYFYFPYSAKRINV